MDEETSHAARHRGAHPEDRRLFDARRLPSLRAATTELSYLLSHGYAPASTLKLVGDRHMLHERQQIAVSRAACSDACLANRHGKRLMLEAVRGEDLLVDGFNLLISLEAALGGGVVLQCRDGCARDIASVHGSYRSVEETDRALMLAAETLAPREPASVIWVLDRPVSNSGRLRQQIVDLAAEHSFPWEVEMAMSPDHVLRASDKIAVTADGTILDNVERWIDLAEHIIRTRLPDAWVVDLADGTQS